MNKGIINLRKEFMEDIVASKVFKHGCLTDSENATLATLLNDMAEQNKRAEDALPKPMDDDRFWTLIHDAGWGRVDHDFKRIHRHFMARMGEGEALSFYQAYQEKCKALVKIADAYLNECHWQRTRHCLPFSGDDGFSDMIAHAVGLGRKFYADVSANILCLQGVDVQESFSYAIPYPSDYMKDPQ